jgi:WD40 repeat protein
VNSAVTNSLKAWDGYLYTCRADGFINCYNMSTNNLVRTFEGQDGICKSIALDENFLYSAGQGRAIKKWNLQTGKLENSFKGLVCFRVILLVGQSEPIFSLVVNDKFLFSSNLDSTITKWDKDTAVSLYTYTTTSRTQIPSIALSEDGQFLFAALQARASVVQWKVSDGAIIQEFIGF